MDDIYSLEAHYRRSNALARSNPPLTPEQHRIVDSHWGDVTAEPGGVDYIECQVGGVPVLWAVPAGAPRDRVIVCLHGGGYIGGSVYTHRKLYAHLAKAVGARAVLPAYSLTPERQYPTQLDECLGVYRGLLDDGTAAEGIALAGDSAGGGLVVSVMLRARAEGLPMAAALVPISPWSDLTQSGAAIAGNRATDVLFGGEHPMDVHALVGLLLPAGLAPTDPLDADPAAVVAARAGLRPALVAGLQYLPPRQQAVLILREVLAFPAGEVAEMLDVSVAAVKSMLQRARARLDEVAPSEEDGALAEPDDPAARALLEQYIAAFERSDVTILERALRTDAAIEAVPSRTWFAGKATCVAYVGQFMGEPGEWRMAATRMNGQPAVRTHLRGVPFGAAVLTVTATGIRRITVFGYPELAAGPA